jgi:hypothetical protein
MGIVLPFKPAKRAAEKLRDWFCRPLRGLDGGARGTRAEARVYSSSAACGACFFTASESGNATLRR